MPRPVDQVARSKGIIPIFEVVAGVGDRGDNETGLSKGQGGIEMAAGPTAAPVREHDQRELRLYPGDRANLAFVSGYLDEFKIGLGQRPPEIIERHGGRPD